MEYKDFPKNNKNEFVSLINCSSQPPLISHGIGKDVESCHDMVCQRCKVTLIYLTGLDQCTLGMDGVLTAGQFHGLLDSKLEDRHVTVSMI